MNIYIAARYIAKQGISPDSIIYIYTRSHREIKCWPVVSCELIGSAAICIYSYRMQC